MSIFLSSTDIIQVLLDAAPATNQLPINTSYVDQGGSGNNLPSITSGTTPVTIVGSPASSVERLVSQISIPNADTATRTVTVNLVRSGVASRLCKITLQAGYALYYDGKWMVLDQNGNFLCDVTVTGGTLTSNQGTPAAIANAWPVEVTDGINVLGTSTHPIRTDPTGTTTQPVSGTVIVNQGTNPWVISGSVSSISGITSASNSTTSTLGSNASFIGASVSVLNYSNIEVIVYSDVSSAINGLLLEFSSDGVNWDDSSVFSFTPGSSGPNQGQAFISGVRGQFFRIVYTNGSVAQTVFRLQTVLKTNIVGGDVLSINGTLNDNNHGLLTVSQIIGKTTGGGGGYVPVKVNPSGTLTVDASNSTNVGVIGTVTANQGTSPWTVQGDSSSGATNAGNPVKIGGAFNTTQPTVANGQTVDAQMTSRGAQIVATGADTFNITVGTALPVGSNTIGSVTQASGPWTFNLTQVDGTVLGAPTTYGIAPSGVVIGVNAFVTNLALAQGSTTSGQTGALVQGAVTTSSPTYTTAQTSPLSLDTSGALRISDSGVPQSLMTNNLSTVATTNFGTSAAKFLNLIIVTYASYTSSASFTVTIEDGSGNTLYSFVTGTIGTSTTIYNYLNMAPLRIAMSNGGNAPKIVTSGTAPTTGYIALTLGWQ